MATKTIAVGSLGDIGVVVWLTRTRRDLVRYIALAMLVAAPWYIFSFVSTGNPVYPIFSGYKLEWDWTFNLLRLADPINPIYVMILPIVWLVRKKIPVMLTAYCLLSFVVWYLTPKDGRGILLPYLPVWSVATAIAIAQKRKTQCAKSFWWGW